MSNRHRRRKAFRQFSELSQDEKVRIYCRLELRSTSVAVSTHLLSRKIVPTRSNVDAFQSFTFNLKRKLRNDFSRLSKVTFEGTPQQRLKTIRDNYLKLTGVDLNKAVLVKNLLPMDANRINVASNAMTIGQMFRSVSSAFIAYQAPGYQSVRPIACQHWFKDGPISVYQIAEILRGETKLSFVTHFVGLNKQVYWTKDKLPWKALEQAQMIYSEVAARMLHGGANDANGAIK